MLTLTAIGEQEKNKLASDSAFIILLDFDLGEHLRICYNNENIIWNGEEYIAFPFTLGNVSESTDGSDPNVELNIDNTTQAFEKYIEDGNGGNGTEVILRVVNTANLQCATPELEEYFTIVKCNVSQQTITFTLGTNYSARSRRPMNRYMKNNCPFKYKGIRCGCTSSLATCDHTLANCRARNNSKRFGGFQGIDQKGVYING